MRQFLKNIMIFFGLQLLILVALHVALARSKLSNEQYLAASIDKHRLISTSAGDRIILIGGSSFAFSIDSKRLKRQLGLYPVNMGLSALLGARFMIAEVEPYLQVNDVVVISLEYEIFGMEMLNDLPSVIFVYNPASIKYLSSLEESKFLLNGGLIHLGKVLRMLTTQVLKREKAIDGLGIYRRSGFNRYGDFVNHWKAEKINPIQPGWPVFNSDRLDSIVESLNQFHARCKEKDVKLFYSYPPYPKSHAAIFPKIRALRRICKRFEDRLTIPLLNSYEESLYDDNLFYDSCYHLNYKGVVRKTLDITESLRRALQ